MKKAFFFLFASGALAAGFSGCSISGSGGTNPPVSQFAYLQASPNAPNLDIYLNGSAVAYNFPYTSDTGYFLAQPGIYNLQAVPTGTSTAILNTNISFSPGLGYSIFTIDSLSKIKAAVVVDSFTAPSSDSARIRFFHFCTNQGSVDLGVTGVVTPWYSSRTFNDQATNATLDQFIEVPAATYNLEARITGVGTVVTTAPGTVLQGGKVYTLFLKGFAGGTGTQALGIGVMNNN